MDDGVYRLSFANCDAKGDDASFRSDGLAVLRDGLLLGSDRHGGVFRGHCQFDKVRGEAVVSVRLALPPNGVLLTGLEAGPDGAVLEISGSFAPPKPVSTTVIEIGGRRLAVELRFVGPLKHA